MPDDDDLNTPPLPPVHEPPPPAPAPPAPVVAAPPPPPPPAPEPAPRPSPDRALRDDYKARGRKQVLRELFGTDDEEQVRQILVSNKDKLAQFEALRTQEEQRKRESMSEVERLTADVQRLTAENEQLKAQVESLKKDQVASQQDVRLRGIAGKFIRPNRVKFALTEFREYVLALTPTQRKLLDEKRTASWFQRFAKENPDLALEAEQPAPSLPAAQPPPAPSPPAPTPARVVPAGARLPARPPVPNAPPAPPGKPRV